MFCFGRPVEHVENASQNITTGGAPHSVGTWRHGKDELLLLAGLPVGVAEVGQRHLFSYPFLKWEKILLETVLVHF